MQTLDEIVGKETSLYKVDDSARTFVLRHGKFWVMEDESDGYRSSMFGVTEVPNNNYGHDYVNVPVKIETVVAPSERKEDSPLCNVDSGYRIVGTDGHIWLEFGTDNEDDYYPSFVFHYTPKKEKQ